MNKKCCTVLRQRLSMKIQPKVFPVCLVNNSCPVILSKIYLYRILCPFLFYWHPSPNLTFSSCQCNSSILSDAPIPLLPPIPILYMSLSLSLSQKYLIIAQSEQEWLLSKSFLSSHISGPVLSSLEIVILFFLFPVF